MTFDQLTEIFQRHLTRTQPDRAADARASLAEWLDDAGGVEAALSGEVRIILVAAGFGTEITTTVLWLNEVYNLDIAQLIPLPEADEFTVKLRRREQATRHVSDGRDWTQYIVTSPDGESTPAQTAGRTCHGHHLAPSRRTRSHTGWRHAKIEVHLGHGQP